MAFRIRGLLSVLIVAVACAAAATPVEACAVCFAGIESPLLDSARAGVVTMALVLAAVLGAFVRWFVRLARLQGHEHSR